MEGRLKSGMKEKIFVSPVCVFGKRDGKVEGDKLNLILCPYCSLK